MIGHQDPACMHKVPIGSRCEKCGTVVGTSGPDQVKTGQIWRARSWPYGKIAVVSAEDGHVEWIQADGKFKWPESNFRDEFWFWGEPEDTTIQKGFEARARPIIEKIMSSDSLAERAEATKLLSTFLEEFKKVFGFAPVIHVSSQGEDAYCVVEWPNEILLRKAIAN